MATTRVLRSAERIRSVRTGLVSRLAHALRRFFREQAERVVSRYLRIMGVKDGRDAEPFLPLGEDLLLGQIIVTYTGVAMEEVGSLAADLAGGSPFTSTGDPRLQALLRTGGRRIAGINEETRQAIMRTIAEGSRLGYTPYQIANGVPADGFRGLRAVVEETYTGRAETIARTELGSGANLAAIDRYQTAGMRYVELMDGPGCGLTSHRDPQKANGLIVPIAVARRWPICHPNCRRIVLGWRPNWTSSPGRVEVPAIVRAS